MHDEEDEAYTKKDDKWKFIFSESPLYSDTRTLDWRR